MQTATLIMLEDQAKMLGKPEMAPTTVKELTHTVYVCVIHLDLVVRLKGNHQRWVQLIREILNDKDVESSLSQAQIIDIFWTIF